MEKTQFDSRMHKQMALWVSQVNEATGFLKRFYAALKDPTQRDRAKAAGSFARERARSAGGRSSLTVRPWMGQQPTSAERLAWISTIEGLLGLNILVALADSNIDRKHPSPLHSRLDRELTSAVHGFSTAFPRCIVEGDLDILCLKVIDDAADVAEAAWRDIRYPNEFDMNPRNLLKQEWLKALKPSLLKRLEQY
jgi:hypothetical protein